MRDFTPTYRLCLAEAIMALTVKTAGVISGVSCNLRFSFITVLGLTPLVSPGLPQTRVTQTPGCGTGRRGLAPSSATNPVQSPDEALPLALLLPICSWHSWVTASGTHGLSPDDLRRL